MSLHFREVEPTNLYAYRAWSVLTGHGRSVGRIKYVPGLGEGYSFQSEEGNVLTLNPAALQQILDFIDRHADDRREVPEELPAEGATP